MEPTDTLSGNELIPRWIEPAGLKPILAQAVLTSLEEFILQELAKGRRQGFNALKTSLRTTSASPITPSGVFPSNNGPVQHSRHHHSTSQFAHWLSSKGNRTLRRCHQTGLRKEKPSSVREVSRNQQAVLRVSIHCTSIAFSTPAQWLREAALSALA